MAYLAPAQAAQAEPMRQKISKNFQKFFGPISMIMCDWRQNPKKIRPPEYQIIITARSGQPLYQE